MKGLKDKVKNISHINKIRNENGDITTDCTEIESIMRLLWTVVCQQIR